VHYDIHLCIIASKHTVYIQRGDTKAQNGYDFCMLLGYGSPNWPIWQDSSSALICGPDFKDSNAAKLETGKLGGPYVIGRGVNPTF